MLKSLKTTIDNKLARVQSVARDPARKPLRKIVVEVGDLLKQGGAPTLYLERLLYREGTGSVRPAPAEEPRPTVSVVVPAYNRELTLPRTLDSVLAQTYADFEVLVVDDGSADGTAAVAEAYAGRDGRVRLLRQPRNAGVSAARNRGLREARGEFVAFLDSDDEWLPEMLARQVGRFREVPDDVGLVYCGVETVVEGGAGWTFRPRHRGDVYGRLLLKNVVHTGSAVMVRRRVVESAGLFDEGIPAIEDYEYWLRVARHHPFDFVEDPLVRYHDARAPGRKSLDVGDNMEAREWFFQKHRADMERAGVAHLFLLDTVRRQLRSGHAGRGSVRDLVLRAARLRPLSVEVHRALVRHVWPRGLYRALRAGRGAVRALAGRAAS